MAKKAVPKVAVITRTKDRGLLLERTIQSVHSQTMTDFLHVIVNDGGNKIEVEAIINKQADSVRNRIKLIDNERAAGLTSALNAGIQACESEYISVLDDDDTWAPDYLKHTTEHLDKSGSMGVVTVIDKIEESIKDGKVTQLNQSRWRPDITAVSLYGQCLDNYAPTVAFVYRREVYDELGGYDETLGVVEDWEFTLRFLLKYDIDFLNTKEALAFYHHRPQTMGALGNSVFAGVDQHKAHLNMLANRFLRDDIAKGRFGIGYIMNSLRYERDVLREQQRQIDLEQTVRIEGHINYAIDQLEHKLTDLIDKDLADKLIRNLYQSKLSYQAYKKARKFTGRNTDRNND